MKRPFRVIGLTAAATMLSIPTFAEKPAFEGSWCVGREGLLITFSGDDSLSVTNLRDEGVQGAGTYTVDDSMLTASMSTEELTLEMGYQYRWTSDSLLRAKITFFTIDGDSVNHPRRWLRMRRCDPDNIDLEELVSEEETTDDEE
ncbi:MAG: hypothetical protein GF344_19230 [Chitinivibrionales bacterium]|nr:hypothetical protein [Chitinivibrionales bacterium]MBD3358757.1 hypothetical protein [Chitinivibrionales bacterium]